MAKSPHADLFGKLQQQRQRLKARREQEADGAAKARLATEIQAIDERLPTLAFLDAQWNARNLGTYVEMLEKAVRAEQRRISSLDLLPDEIETVRQNILEPLTRTIEAFWTAPPSGPDDEGAAGAAGLSAFQRTMLVRLARAEAEKETVLTADSAARKYVRPFERHFGTWNIPWCATFAHWCLNETRANFPIRVPGQQGFTFAYNVAWRDWAQASGLYRRRDEHDPLAGDLVFFEWKDDEDDRTDHVGIVLEVKPDHLITAEGNTRNRRGESFSSAIRERRFGSVDGYVVLADGFRFPTG